MTYRTNRREFLRHAGAAMSLAGAAGTTIAGDPVQNAFEQALTATPWLNAFASAQQNDYRSTVEINGRWPDELRGTLYRNGPARHEVGGFRYRHWFDGDGMLHAYRSDGTRLHHRARMIETPKYQAETAAGRALYPAFDSVPPNPAEVSSADAINPANISVLPHHGKLLALWEAGSPLEVDAETLDTLGVYAFSDETAGAPFSAHPRVEPDGTLWNFGYLSSAGLMALWHVDSSGRVVKTGTVPTAPMGMPHDFVVTSRHLVILIAPLHYRTPEGTSFLGAHEWEPDHPAKILVVDKNDFSAYRWLELPAQWVFHFGNGWEEKNGIIHFDGARADSPALMFDDFRALMRGERPRRQTSVRQYRYQVDLRRNIATEAPMFDERFSTEFPTIDPRVSCRRNDRLVMLHRKDEKQALHPMFCGVSLYDMKADKLRSFDYPPTVMPEEHLFVPTPGSEPESDGWIVGTAYDFGNLRTELNVFDVAHLEDGPIARAELPYALPFGLHGKFAA